MYPFLSQTVETICHKPERELSDGHNCSREASPKEVKALPIAMKEQMRHSVSPFNNAQVMGSSIDESPNKAGKKSPIKDRPRKTLRTFKTAVELVEKLNHMQVRSDAALRTSAEDMRALRQNNHIQATLVIRLEEELDELKGRVNRKFRNSNHHIKKRSRECNRYDDLTASTIQPSFTTSIPAPIDEISRAISTASLKRTSSVKSFTQMIGHIFANRRRIRETQSVLTSMSVSELRTALTLKRSQHQLKINQSYSIVRDHEDIITGHEVYIASKQQIMRRLRDECDLLRDLKEREKLQKRSEREYLMMRLAKLLELVKRKVDQRHRYLEKTQKRSTALW